MSHRYRDVGRWIRCSVHGWVRSLHRCERYRVTVVLEKSEPEPAAAAPPTEQKEET